MRSLQVSLVAECDLHSTVSVENDDPRGNSHTVDSAPPWSWLTRLRAAASTAVKEVRGNAKAGVTVALVNLPLSIALAVASQTTPSAGVVTAFWAGLVTAVVGGSQYNIVGPTGALSGMLAAMVAINGASSLSMVALLTGVISLAVWALKLERFVMLVPASVTEGFTLGVAIIIALNQLNSALGLSSVDIPKHEGLLENVWENLVHVRQASWVAVTVFCICFVALFVLLHWKPSVPWMILISAMGIAVGALGQQGLLPFAGSDRLPTLKTKYGDLVLHLFDFPQFSRESFSMNVFASSVPVAFVAVLETLISAKIADRMTRTRFNQRREVLGLGLANIISGVFSGIPATAALARTALNIKSRATSRASAIINCIALLMLSLVLLRYFVYLPLAVVGAQVCIVAVRMVETEKLLHVFHGDRIKFGKLIIVAVICIVKDTTYGILVGMMISLLRMADQLAHGHSEVHFRLQGKHDLGVCGGEPSASAPAAAVTAGSSTEALAQSGVSFASHGASPQALLSQPAVMGAEYQCFDGEELRGKFSQSPDMTGSCAVYRMAGCLNFINAAGHVLRLEALGEFPTIVISLRYVFLLDLEGVEALKEIVHTLENEQCKTVVLTVNESNLPILQREPWFMRKFEKGEVLNGIALDNTSYAAASPCCTSDTVPLTV